MFLLFLITLIYSMLAYNRLLASLIMVEMISVVFLLNFSIINVFQDHIFLVVFSFFILESVVGLMLLLLLINFTGSDYCLVNSFNF